MNTLLDSILNNVAVQITFWSFGGFWIIFDIALAWWVYRDISSRTHELGLRILATIFVLLLNLPALLLYVLFRPMQTLHEKEMERLELEIFKTELADVKREAKKEEKREDKKEEKKDEKKEDKKDKDK
jgi:hypothetical protein